VSSNMLRNDNLLHLLHDRMRQRFDGRLPFVTPAFELPAGGEVSLSYCLTEAEGKLIDACLPDSLPVGTDSVTQAIAQLDQRMTDFVDWFADDKHVVTPPNGVQYHAVSGPAPESRTVNGQTATRDPDPTLSRVQKVYNDKVRAKAVAGRCEHQFVAIDVTSGDYIIHPDENTAAESLLARTGKSAKIVTCRIGKAPEYEWEPADHIGRG